MLAFIIPATASAKVTAITEENFYHYDTNTYIENGWKFKAAADEECVKTDFDDSTWMPIESSLMSREQRKVPSWQGSGWFRTIFSVTPALYGKRVILSMYSGGICDIYYDGNYIGKVTNKNDLLFIDFNEKSEHILAVKYNCPYYKHLSFSGFPTGFSLFLNDPSTVFNYKINTERSNSIPQIAFTFLIIGIAILHLILFYNFREVKANLYYSLFGLMFAGVVFFDYQSTGFSRNLFENMQYLRIQRIFVVFAFLLFMIFTNSIFSLKRNILFIPICIGLIITGSLAVWRPGENYIFVLIFIMIIYIDVSRILINAIRNNIKGARLFLFGYLFILVFSLYDVLLDMGATTKFMDIENAYFFGYLGLFFSMSINLSKDIAKKNKDLKENLNQVKLLSEKTIEQEKEKQRIIEGQKERLEILVKKRTIELETEKEKSDNLLHNILPKKVADDLKKSGISDPDTFNDVSILFSDLVNFTEISSGLEPKKLIEELNEIFTAFDDIIEKHQCERIKTIGDAYLAVCGMPIGNINHADLLTDAAIEIVKYMRHRNTRSTIKWEIRIGIHSGKVTGGIVGLKKYIYDVFGDAINTASRMESCSEPMKINISDSTYNLLKQSDCEKKGISFRERETITVKGKGLMKMYFVEKTHPEG